MAEVKVFFPPYGYEGATVFGIEESDDNGDADPWGEIEEVIAAADVGVYPDYATSYLTSLATGTDKFFRVVWKAVAAGSSLYTTPGWQPGTLHARYTVPQQHKDFSRYEQVTGLGSVYIQYLINRAWFMLQNNCGPFDESGTLVYDDEVVTFKERAELAMFLLVDRLAVASDPQVVSASLGFIEETRGSYRYRLSERAIDLVQHFADEIPVEIRELVCPFGVSGESAIELITTDVFTQTDKYVITTEDSDDRRYIYTEEERHGLTAPKVIDRTWVPD